jgi:putative IMPACT (imprinted ancient) family translation regulator
MHAVGRLGAKIEGTEYDGEVHLLVSVRASRADELETSLLEVTRGGIRVKREDQAVG